MTFNISSFSQSDIVDFLSSNGFRFSLDGSSLISLSHSYFPSVSYRKASDCFVLSFSHPLGFGSQHFSFSLDDFIFAFQNSKGKRYLSSSFPDFNSFFFSQFYPDADNYVKICFALFSITPSVLLRSQSQNKKLHRIVRLKPKISSVVSSLSSFGISCPQFKEVGQKKSDSLNVSSDSFSSCGNPPSCRVPADSPLISSLDNQLDSIITTSASRCDLSFFNSFLDVYNKKQKALSLPQCISLSKRNKLFFSFKSLVSQKQKELF